MNIHLVNDEIFINKSLERFEHFYPDQNIFFVNVHRSANNLKYVKLNEKIIPLSFLNSKSVDTILEYCDNKTRIFVHYLDPMQAYIIINLKEYISPSIYWIYYGSDMYHLLYKKHNLELNDYVIPNRNFRDRYNYIKEFMKTMYIRFKVGSIDIYSNVEKVIYSADYFCFWNKYDYNILTKYYNTNIKFKYFRYYESPVKDAFNAPFEKVNGSILVNHSASKYGNHLTILNKLRTLDKKKKLNQVITPLSYGSRVVKEMTFDYGMRYLDYCFKPVFDFIPRHEYFRNLNTISSAIFGHRRQAAGNNIYYLLAAGTKIFLRRDNSLLKYCREKGYHVFELEKDLNGIDDLSGLDRVSQVQNRKLVEEEFSQNVINETYMNLLKNQDPVK